MNNSDKNNPRRLIRAIELSLGIPNDEEICSLPENLLKLRFGLTSDLEIILEKISQRVADRFNAGVIKEVEKVNKICRQNNLPVCSTLGIKDLTAYIKNEINLEKCLKLWALHEFQYSKRQLVWLKKEKEVIWLDDLTKSSYTLVDEKIFI